MKRQIESEQPAAERNLRSRPTYPTSLSELLWRCSLWNHFVLPGFLLEGSKEYVVIIFYHVLTGSRFQREIHARAAADRLGHAREGNCLVLEPGYGQGHSRQEEANRPQSIMALFLVRYAHDDLSSRYGTRPLMSTSPPSKKFKLECRLGVA
ncbi:unnamed protein product [Nezara viridula]|uniref:Uncharacterized protein n=1 Tax=Nezara viridula TaxID=85310 RepID=A0A9P0HC11_NEZVI|nr:unnamed protein product [Nezara viridula]